MALLGFGLVREGNHLALERKNEDGSKTPVTLPNHWLIIITGLSKRFYLANPLDPKRHFARRVLDQPMTWRDPPAAQQCAAPIKS